MGITTDFIGVLGVTPALNDAEQQYLTAFSTSRRFARPDGPYTVPFNPAADRDTGHDLATFNVVADGQPSLWCQWIPAWDGRVLSYDGHEKFYAATRWLQYLIDHFLRPGGEASHSGLNWFGEFTFDHRVDGVVAAYPHDTGEMYLIRADDNVVTQTLLGGSTFPTVDPPLLPYQRVAAEWRRERPRPRPRNVANRIDARAGSTSPDAD